MESNRSVVASHVLPGMPGVAGSYAAILFRRRAGLSDPTLLQRASRAVDGVSIDRAHLGRYASLVGLPDGLAELPPLYLQLVASPLHLALLAAPTFPWPALGVVHLRNHVWQTRAISIGATLRVEATVCDARAVENGIEFDIETVAYDAGEAVWRSVIVALRRQKVPDGIPRSERAASREPLGVWGESARVEVPEAMGRRYAAVAGDWNPIHQRAFLARFFGFKRAIVHGTWTLGRALALAPTSAFGALELDAVFRKPVMLPSAISVRWGAASEGWDGTVRSADGKTLHATVSLRRGA